LGRGCIGAEVVYQPVAAEQCILVFSIYFLFILDLGLKLANIENLIKFENHKNVSQESSTTEEKFQV
jgi:hypothetical protein